MSKETSSIDWFSLAVQSKLKELADQATESVKQSKEFPTTSISSDAMAHAYNVAARLLEENIEQARVLHRREIESAFGHGQNNGYLYANGGGLSSESKQDYYDKTFNSNNT